MVTPRLWTHRAEPEQSVPQAASKAVDERLAPRHADPLRAPGEAGSAEASRRLLSEDRPCADAQHAH